MKTFIEPYGAMKAFAAAGSDNTSSCMIMRQIVADAYPGIVSLNDQSHVASLAITDMCKTSFCKRVIAKVLVINNLIMNHQYVLAVYCRLMAKFNTALKAAGGSVESDEATVFLAPVDDADEKIDSDPVRQPEETSVNFMTVAKTRFAYRVDIAERRIRNKKVVQEMVDDISYLISKVDSSSTAQATLNEFLAVVDGRQTWTDIKVLFEILTPMRIYLRAFDKDLIDLTVVYSKTTDMIQKYESLLVGVEESTEST